MKTVDDFMSSFEADAPPPELPVALQGLWYSAKGDWERAHILVQDEPGAEAAWVHAHLHRIEGDTGNARYWYTRARREMPNGPIEMERANIARVLISMNCR